MGDDVAEAKGEEGSAADIDVCAELCEETGAGSHHDVAKGQAHGEIEHGKAEDEEDRPYQQQHKK